LLIFDLESEAAGLFQSTIKHQKSTISIFLWGKSLSDIALSSGEKRNR